MNHLMKKTKLSYKENRKVDKENGTYDKYIPPF